MSYEPKAATPATVAAHRHAEDLYDLADRQDFTDARRGLIAPIPDGRTVGDDWKVVFDLGRTPNWPMTRRGRTRSIRACGVSPR